MLKTLIIYESRYGVTKEIAKTLALILGPAKYCTTSEFMEEYKEFDLIVLGSPVYYEVMDEKLMKFIKENKNWLKNKKTALFCSCLALDYGNNYLKLAKEILGGSLLLSSVLGGKITVSKLNENDLKSMETHSKRTGKKLQDSGNFRIEEVIEYALLLKDKRDGLLKAMPEEMLKEEIEGFLKAHNTCALATGSGDMVRVTPIEYMYKDSYIYFITEGGEKFSNILLNPKVSIAIYEDYKNMVDLSSMQITGACSLVTRGTEEYYNVFMARGIKKEALDKIPVFMNLLKVKIDKIETLISKFKGIGYDARQVIKF